MGVWEWQYSEEEEAEELLLSKDSELVLGQSWRDDDSDHDHHVLSLGGCAQAIIPTGQMGSLRLREEKGLV